MIVGITGLKRSGKDTVGVFIKAEGDALSYNFAHPIYSMLENLIGPLPRDGKGEIDKSAVIQPYGVTLRHMLQTLGTEWGRKLVHDNIWISAAKEWLYDVENCTHTPDYIIFSDVRFDNEAAFIKGKGGTIIEVRRDDTEQDGHASEQGISTEFVDLVMHNNGTLQDLQDKVITFLANL